MNTWFSSDPHFGHNKLATVYTTKSGRRAREFETCEAMDELIIRNHNDRVGKNDRWICLGDFMMADNPAMLEKYMSRLNGQAEIVLGNHDACKMEHYLTWFKKVHAMLVLDNILFTHIPIAPWSLNYKVRANVHGHIHQAAPLSYRAADPFENGSSRKKLYLNISMERTNYCPIDLARVNRLITVMETQ